MDVEPSAALGGWCIRAWHDDDASSLPDLLDDAPDRLWLRQFHRLHGANRDFPRWRRTLVATVDGRVVGAASVVVNRVHPGRWPCAIEVAPGWRRRGIGSALLVHVQAEHPQARPMSSEVRPDDAAATGFVSAAGGGTYQRCPGQVVEPSSAAAIAWADHSLAQARAAGLKVDGLQQWPAGRVTEVFAAQYRWVHEAWSPVPSTPAATAALRSAAGAAAEEADPQLSSAAWRGAANGAELLAVAFAFPAGDGGVEVVAEAVEPPTPGGEAQTAVVVTAVRACVARSLAVARDQDAGAVELDGHDDDPHLQRAVVAMPTAGCRPVLLVELGRAPSAGGRGSPWRLGGVRAVRASNRA